MVDEKKTASKKTEASSTAGAPSTASPPPEPKAPAKAPELTEEEQNKKDYEDFLASR